jgi:hypothetical protein
LASLELHRATITVFARTAADGNVTTNRTVTSGKFQLSTRYKTLQNGRNTPEEAVTGLDSNIGASTSTATSHQLN